jgi:hypothetical protein
MDSNKLNFLLYKYPSLLKSLDPSIKALWGKMNVQQMIEHMSDSVRQANGKVVQDIVTPAEHLPKYKEFLMTEKEFRPNTKNAIMGEEPEPVKNVSVSEAIAELEKELKDFVKRFENDHQSIITNPIFGDLNFEEWIQLLHKHAVHHLKQFGVEVS